MSVCPADYYHPLGFVFWRGKVGKMQTDLILPGSLILSEQERIIFRPPSVREPSTVTAHRLGQALATVIISRFPSLEPDRVLLERQIESDYLDWALQRGVFVSGLRRSL